MFEKVFPIDSSNSMSSLRRNSAPEIQAKSEVPKLREYLERSDIFSACPRTVQDALMNSFHYRHFNDKDFLIQSGTKASTILILLKGNLQVISEKYEAVLAELGPGMIFGEIGAIFGVPRTASVVAKSSGLVASIDRDHLKQIIGADKRLWTHIKGIAMSRYRLTSADKLSKPVKLSSKELDKSISRHPMFKNVPRIVIEKLILLCQAEEYTNDTVVDFFSPREHHSLYMILEGSVAKHSLSGSPTVLGQESVFRSYEDDLDFVKIICDKTLLLKIDVQQASAIFSDDAVELGEEIFGTNHLTDHVDANTSMTSGALESQRLSELGSILNPAQFSRKRRNSAPIFSDLGRENGLKFPGIRDLASQEMVSASSKQISDQDDLKNLLLNAGIVVPDNVSLLFESRLSLSPIKNELTDSILLAIMSILGSRIKVLNLSDCHLLTSSGVLAIWLHCPNLEKVSLQGCWNLDDSAFSTLSRCQCADSIKEFNLSNCWRFTSKLLSLIGTSKITKLDLSFCKKLDDRTWPALTQFSNSLRSLKMKRCIGITDSSFEGIFGSTFIDLEYLDLSECALITDSALTTILAAAPNLRFLNLSLSTSIKGNFLLHHESLPKLRSINLSYQKEMINEAFCSRLVKVCPNIEELMLDGCSELDEDCLAHFLGDNLVNLSKLNVNNCSLLSGETISFINLKYN